MLRTKAPSPIPYLIVAVGLLIGGYWWFHRNSPPQPTAATAVKPTPSSSAPAAQPDAATPSLGGTNAPSSQPSSAFAAPRSLPAGTRIAIDGSTSMVTINRNLRQAFERQFPGTQVVTRSSGSNAGVQALQTGTIDLAALSRPLTAQESAQGLQAVPIATDAIALVVGVNNPFKGDLTSSQVEGIFSGTIVNWSQVGGINKMIKVVNRPAVSGTHQAFKDLVLKGNNFGNTMNITTLDRDATTPLLRALGNDGIGYATYAQVANQRTVRVVSIAGLKPTSPNYPYSRSLFYVFKSPPNSNVRAFIGYALSPQGQQAMMQE